MASMKDLLGELKNTASLMERQSAAFGDVVTDLSSSYKLGSDLVQANAQAVADMQKALMGASKTQSQSIRLQGRVAKEIASSQKEMKKIQKEIEEARANGDAAEIERLNYKLANEFKQTKRIMDYRTQRIQEEQNLQDEQFKAYKDLMTNHRKNLKEMGGFAKNIGGQLKGGDVAGAASGMADGMAGVLKQLSGVGGKLGAVAGALGMTVGLLGMFVALMFEADKKAKDLNKNFMTGASGLDLMNKNFQRGQLTQRLKAMRDMAYDVGMKFRMSAEEVATLASTFNQFGLRYDEIGGMVGTTDDPVIALERTLEMAIGKSKMLGVEATVVAETMAQMNENFAMDLSQIDEAFAAIYTSAQTTGIATQKFFAMITQVTGGMSLLNVDFAQTAAIAGELVESLGEAAGSKFLQDLANRGASKSYEERFKSYLLSGKKTGRISKKGVQARARQLESSSKFQTLTGSDDFKRAIRSLGVDNFDSTDIMGSLKNMSKTQQGNLIASMGNTSIGGSAEIERQMRALQQLHLASQQGGMFGGAVQQGQFNTGENLAQFLAEAGAFADLSKGQSLGGMSRAKLEKISGKSGMEVDQLVTMVDKMNSNMGVVKTYSDRMNQMMKEGKTGEAALAELAAEQGLSPEEFQKMLQEQYKLTVGEDGKVKSSITGQEITNLEDYMINMGDSMKDGIKEALTKEEIMTQEIVSNTASASMILENIIGKQLNKISGFVEAIYDAITWEKRDMEGEKRRMMARAVDDQLEKDYEKKMSLQAEVSATDKKIKGGETLSKREKALHTMKKNELETLNIVIDSREKERTALNTLGSEEEINKQLAQINRDQMEAMGKKQSVTEWAKDQDKQNLEATIEKDIAADLQARKEEYVRDMSHYFMDLLMTGKDYDAPSRDTIIDFSHLEHDDSSFNIKDGDAFQYMFDNNPFDMSESEIFEIMREKGIRQTGLRPTGEGIKKMMKESEDTFMGGHYGFSKSVVEGDRHKERQVRAEKDITNRHIAGVPAAEAEGLDMIAVLENMTNEQFDRLDMAREGLAKGGDSTDAHLDELQDEMAKTPEGIEALRKITEKKLPASIGEEVMKAMVAEKLFDVAAGAGVDFGEFMKRMADDSLSAKSYITSGANWSSLDPAAKAELQGIMKTLKVKDGYWDGTTMTPMGEGALIITQDGAYETKGDDKIAIGTNLGGKGAGGGDIVIQGDIVLKGVQDPRSFGKQVRAHFKDRRNRKGKGR